MREEFWQSSLSFSQHKNGGTAKDHRHFVDLIQIAPPSILLWAHNIGKSTFALMVEAVRTGIGTILSCSTNTRIDITGPERGRNPSRGPAVSRPSSPSKDFSPICPDFLHGRASSWLYGEKLNVLRDFLFIQTEKEKRDEKD